MGYDDGYISTNAHHTASRRLGGQAMSTVVRVVFRFPDALAPKARQVAVLGSFNGWAPTAHLLTRAADGSWSVTIYLPPGRVLYHFAVDGVFWLDPYDEGRVPNSWGAEYSIRYVRERKRPVTPTRRRALQRAVKAAPTSASRER
jgi:1,4-alpha-glucan branching enzyme